MADKFQLKALITGVDKLSPALDGIRKKVSGFQKTISKSGLAKGISFGDFVQGGALAAPFIVGAKAAIEFESSMADVRKVVDFDTPTQFKQMGEDVLKMSARLPMAAADIAQIVAAGGQAGLARNELTRFSEDAVKMGVAFDSTAEESGAMMAKWRTSFRMTQDEVVSLADKINYLSNNGPASAAQISSIVTRIGPLGEVAGLASGQIAAMGATLAGMGVQEEVAATGMKNFMLTLTAGTSATKKQREIFKALRMDAKAVAGDMQSDAEGTITRILTAISKVDKTKQAAVLQNLFGRESVGAIAPMLNNLDLLKTNFKNVADETQYAGSMNKEYEARAATTANNIQLLKNQSVALGVSIGSALLPSLNGFIGAARPMIDNVVTLSNAHPWLIKGTLGAALAFGAVRVAVLSAAVATRVLSTVMTMSPMGLVVRGVALAAGFLLANWERVGPWFKSLWDGLVDGASAVWNAIKNVFLNFTPLGLVISNWGPLSAWFTDLFDVVAKTVSQTWEGIKNTLMGFAPIKYIIAAWDPIVGWFESLWERVKGFIAPITDGVKWLSEKFGGLFGGDTTVTVTDDGSGQATGADSAVAGAAASVNGFNEARSNRSDSSASTVALANRTQLDGDIRVVFEGAPPGMRVSATQTNQSGISITSSVGYRTVGQGG